jgi:hypothetical protein
MITGGIFFSASTPKNRVMLFEPPYSFFGVISQELPIELAGYEGEAFVFMAGADSQEALSFDGRRPTQSPGQTAAWRISVSSTVTGFSLEQVSFHGSRDLAKMHLTVVGGPQDGQRLTVGSGRTRNSYGNVGAVQESTSLSTLSSAELIYQGCRRMSDATENYSDDTSYPPDNYVTYGQSIRTFDVNGETLTMRNSEAPGGLEFRGVDYGRSGKAGRVGTDFTHYAGCAVIFFTGRPF